VCACVCIDDVAGAVVTSAMLVSLTAMTDCGVHWAGAVSVLVVAVSFCGVQLGAGALVTHLDVASRHADVIVAVTSTVGASTYFLLPAFRRVVSAALQVGVSSNTNDSLSFICTCTWAQDLQGIVFVMLVRVYRMYVRTRYATIKSLKREVLANIEWLRPPAYPGTALGPTPEPP